jgi:hypothetical protein
MGLITPCSRKNGDLWLILLGQDIAAQKIGCTNVGRYPVRIPAHVLVENGWHSWIWISNIATHKGKPISRPKLREMTGVPESTQRKYEKSIPIEHRPNYIISDQTIDHLPIIREYLYSYAFSFWDNDNKRWVVARRGPDSRDSSKFVDCLNRGRSKKINKKLNQNRGLLNVEQAQSDDGLFIRLFNETPKQLRETQRKLINEGVSTEEVSAIFELIHKGKNAYFWREIPE